MQRFHHRLELAQGRSTHDCARYLLYNPLLSSLPERDQQLILHQLKADASHIFDYIPGQFLYEQMSNGRGSALVLDTGMLLLPLPVIHTLSAGAEKQVLPRLAHQVVSFTLHSVIESINVRKNSCPGFMVFGLLLGQL